MATQSPTSIYRKQLGILTLMLLSEARFPAAERGEITVESTGNGVGNWYHRMCVRARQGRGFKLHFYSWLDMPDYSIAFGSDEERAAFALSLDEELEEQALLARGVTLEQLQWRRERLTIDFEGDMRSFKEAYPIDFDECFQSSGYGFFQKVRYKPTALWRRESAHLHVLDGHPAPEFVYVIGADPSGGVGNDNACAQVFCLNTREQVAEYASPWCEPDAFAGELCALGKRFNNGYINVERNNHGGTTLSRLLDVYPVYLIHRGSHGEPSSQEVLSRLSHYGTNVSPGNRGIIIGTTRTLLKDEFTIHSPTLKAELDTFVERDGKIAADEGCFDDRVMAACHALIVVEQQGLQRLSISLSADAPIRTPSGSMRCSVSNQRNSRCLAYRGSITDACAVHLEGRRRTRRRAAACARRALSRLLLR
jgi:hypothetical protein